MSLTSVRLGSGGLFVWHANSVISTTLNILFHARNLANKMALKQGYRVLTIPGNLQCHTEMLWCYRTMKLGVFERFSVVVTHAVVDKGQNNYTISWKRPAFQPGLFHRILNWWIDQGTMELFVTRQRVDDTMSLYFFCVFTKYNFFQNNCCKRRRFHQIMHYCASFI